MDRFRQLLSYINAQLSGLTLSQRVAIGLCAALIAGSLLWLVQWSTTPEMVPLLTREVSYSELDAAEGALKTNNIAYEIQGTRIFVRAADRHNALRLMHSAGALPEGSLFDMAAAVTKQNPFQSPEARDYAENYAKGNELAKVISTSPVVHECYVLINPRTKRRLGGHSDVPTASVSVKLKPNVEMTPEMVESCAKLVAGAVAGLKPQNVTVTDGRSLRSYSVPNPNDAVSFDYLNLVKQREQYLRSKILSKLADIPGVQVAVSVELDTSKRVTQNIKHDQPQPKVEQSETTETNAASQPAEAGMQPNLGQAISATSSGQGSSTEQSSVENFEPKVSQTETIEHLPFATKTVSAAIGIPRSFIVGIFKARNADKPEPADDDPEFTAVRDAQIARVKKSVERIVMAKAPDDVAVDVYPDMDWTADGGSWSRAPGGPVPVREEDGVQYLGLARDYGPQFGLLLLAFTGLMMMMRIVKKAAPGAVPASLSMAAAEEVVTEEPILSVGSHAVGQAEVSEGLLTGREVDDRTLRFQELGREVSKMVQQDPQGSAELIRRWIDDA